MMNADMKKAMMYIGAIGAAIACLIMVIYEVFCMHVPAFAWFAFSACMFAYVIAERSRKKAE